MRLAAPGSAGRLELVATGPDGDPVRLPADVVLIVGGVRPDTDLLPRPALSSASNRRPTAPSTWTATIPPSYQSRRAESAAADASYWPIASAVAPA
jgi:hypothetical protein